MEGNGLTNKYPLPFLPAGALPPRPPLRPARLPGKTWRPRPPEAQARGGGVGLGRAGARLKPGTRLYYAGALRARPVRCEHRARGLFRGE